MTQAVRLIKIDSIPIEAKEESDGLSEALMELSTRLLEFKKLQVDAMGLTIDPTCSLSAHRILPFNNPAVIQEVLTQQLTDIWKIDENTHLAFEVGEFVETKAAGEGEEAAGGYDIHVINYPKDRLKELLGRLKAAQIDPHVVLPSTDAFGFAMNTAIQPPGGVWVVIDLGQDMSMLSICSDDQIKLTRALKVGTNDIDRVLAQTFNMSDEEARQMRKATGFLALPGRESSTYSANCNAGRIEPWQVDAVALSNGCARGLEVLLTAIRQTVGTYASQNRCEPECIYLTGEGSDLCGLTEWLSAVLEVRCVLGVPTVSSIMQDDAQKLSVDVDCVSAAVAAAAFIEDKCPLNLRRGELAHKGSLAYIQDHKWLIASCVLAVIIAVIFMGVTDSKAIKEEHAKLKSALEEASMNTFGKKLMDYNKIEKEISKSGEFDFIPARTAFTHFAWISNNVNNNMADVEMDLSSLDIDMQRKIVTIKGEVSGDDGLPRFMQLLEQYECFPKDIPEPKTQKVKEKTSFTLRVDATHCTMGADSE